MTNQSPERALWQSVILQAIHDALWTDVNGKELTGERKKDKFQADHWLRGGGRDFKIACQCAGFDHDFIRDAYVSGRIKPENLHSKKGMK